MTGSDRSARDIISDAGAGAAAGNFPLYYYFLLFFWIVAARVWIQRYNFVAHYVILTGICIMYMSFGITDPWCRHTL